MDFAQWLLEEKKRGMEGLEAQEKEQSAREKERLAKENTAQSAAGRCDLPLFPKTGTQPFRSELTV